MESNSFLTFDPYTVPSPCFVVDEAKMEDNLLVLDRLRRQSGAGILLSLKAFSMFALAPLTMRYLNGTSASGLHEARLGREEFGKEVHTFCPAFHEDELEEILGISDLVTFNSFSQWRRFEATARNAARNRSGLRFGLRVNPECSVVVTRKYDPATPFSRLGIVAKLFDGESLEGISGLHFHNLCEQDLPPLQRTLAAVEDNFGDLLGRMEWVNWGGGHLITRPDYQLDELIALIRDFRDRFGVEVWLEPGAAVVLNAGILVSEILDITWNGMDVAILDSSATAHMPDLLEMPYKAEIIGAAAPGEHPHLYQLGGRTCMAGDVFGDYAFPEALKVGDRIMFRDMAHYTVVKTTTFNGVRLPSLAIWNSRTGKLRVVKDFGYEDFRARLS